MLENRKTSSAKGGTPYQSSAGRKEPRRWSEKGFLSFRLDILTPVFIGSGEELSPLEYVIRKEGNGYVLHLVDTQSWLMAVQDKKDIMDALERGDLLRLRRLMDEQLDEKQFSLSRIAVPSSLTANKLIDTIHNPKSLSKAEIQSFIRNPSTLAAFVPGSSLKGAISTPIIDHFDGGKLQAAAGQGKFGYNDAMKNLFGDIKEHAMQALKVSDIPVPLDGTRLVASAEVGRTNKDGTPKTPCEVLPPSTAESIPLYGRLFMDTVSAGGEPRITMPRGKSVTFTELATWCNAFYTERFRKEMANFYQLGHLLDVRDALQSVEKRINSLDAKREILLRVGHYSHVECVTVTRNAPQAKKGFGKTRTLADRKLPFGWVVLTLCSEEEYRAGLVKVEASIATTVRQREEARVAREADMNRVLEAQRQKAEAAQQAKIKAAEEQKQREREAAEREAKLAALSPEERLIAEVAAPDAAENKSSELYKMLDTLEPALQVKAAEALKTCWERLKKWSGKKLTDKQKKKVERVSAVLAASAAS